MSIGNCSCDKSAQHAVCDESYLYAPLYAPSKAQLAAEGAKGCRPVISAEPIEAAAKAIFDVRDDPYDMDEWGDLDSIAREPYVCQARAALEAAAPHIRSAAWLEGYEDGFRAGDTSDAARAKSDALEEAASLVEPFSGIGMANGATRGEVAQWLRARAAILRAES